MCVHAVRACVRVCMRARVRTCIHAYVHACLQAGLAWFGRILGASWEHRSWSCSVLGAPRLVLVGFGAVWERRSWFW